MKLPQRPSADYFAANREQVMKQLQGGLLVMAGYTAMQRTNDEESRFAQEGTFWWLTGVEFADWWLIIDARRGKSWLVEPTIDERHRLFTKSLLANEATAVSGITEVINRDQAMRMFRAAAKTRQMVYTVGQSHYAQYFDFVLNPASKNLRDILERTFASVQDFRNDIAKLRAIKQPIELKWMQAAIDTTTATLSTIHDTMSQFHHEYEIEAELSYAFRKNGASGHAFDPIVAAGGNATTAHYFTNNGPVKKRNFVTIDVGARVNGFAADITRTYAKDTPSARMKAVHTAVQSAQRQIIDLLTPGLSVEEYHARSDEIVKREMLSLGLMSSLDDTDNYHRYMPHSVSHGLGVDLHEALGMAKQFEEGMVLTVEPGIYIPEEQIGVRVEDDILITKNGHKNLSGALPTGW